MAASDDEPSRAADEVEVRRTAFSHEEREVPLEIRIVADGDLWQRK